MKHFLAIGMVLLPVLAVAGLTIYGRVRSRSPEEQCLDTADMPPAPMTHLVWNDPASGWRRTNEPLDTGRALHDPLYAEQHGLEELGGWNDLDPK